jgi:transcriptional regulator GlxA family with amidase domain
MLPKRIGFFGFERIAASDLTSAAAVFVAAALDAGYGDRLSCYNVQVIGFTLECFRSESNIAFRPDSTVETVSDLDTLVVPGGDGLRQPLVSERIADWVLTRVNQTRRIAAIGSGIYGLAPTGLLDGRKVTTHWHYASDVARRFPNLRLNAKTLVKDGAFYTSSGPSAAMDLSLALIQEDYGRHVALAAAQGFVASSSVTENAQHNIPRPRVFDSQPTERFADLIPWIMRNLNGDLSVNSLARRACMSPSHFTRVFKSVIGSTPSEFVETLRINEARRRLSVPKRTLEAIAASVGFSDAESFQRAFERRIGRRPRSYLKDLPVISAPSTNGAASLPAKEQEPLAAAKHQSYQWHR